MFGTVIIDAYRECEKQQLADAGFVNSVSNGLNTRFCVYERLVLHLAYTFCRA